MHLCVYMRVAISPPHLAPLTAWQELALGEDGERVVGEADRDGGERASEGQRVERGKVFGGSAVAHSR